MIDLDRRAMPRFGPLYAVCHILGITPEWIRTDRTRRGWHIVIRFPFSFSDGETVALQAILGSDRRRETLNLLRAISRRTSTKVLGKDFDKKVSWNLLFSVKPS